jgi:hypothetical protein
MENTPGATYPKFVRWAVLVGIVILVNIFIFTAISYTFPEPKYDDFCNYGGYPGVEYTEAASCEENGGLWTTYSPKPVVENGPVGYCQINYMCQKEYDAARETKSQHAFLLYVAIAILALLGGTFLKGSSIVSAGLSYGGVLLLIVGSIRYWQDVPELWQLGVSGLALAILIFFAYRKFKD